MKHTQDGGFDQSFKPLQDKEFKTLVVYGQIVL